MGVAYSIGKYKTNEHQLYSHYSSMYDLEADGYQVHYNLPLHKYGRIEPADKLSLSKFHRSSRHTFADENYIDFDMENCHPAILVSLWFNEKDETLKSWAEYNTNVDKNRQLIAEHYELKSKLISGMEIKPEEQTKKLFIALMYGGGTTTWRETWGVKSEIKEHPLIDGMKLEIVKVREAIWEKNKDMIERVESANPEKWDSKSLYEKKSSITALFFQTWERIFQEACITDLCDMADIDFTRVVPCQDGMMLLKNDIKFCDTQLICDGFKKLIAERFKLNITWSVKAFKLKRDDVPLCDDPPLYLPIDDLLNGGKYVADRLINVLYPTLKFYNKSWWHCSKIGIWRDCGSDCPLNIIAEHVLLAVKEISDNLWTLGESKDKEEKLKENLKMRCKYACADNITKIAKYLKHSLLDTSLEKKLDSIPGKLAYNDGVLDLATGVFRKGIRPQDYLTRTMGFKFKSASNKSELREHFKKICNYDEEHLEYYLSVIGYAFTGESQHLQKLWSFVGETAANGKSTPFDALTEICPNYVVKLASDDLALSTKSTRGKMIGTIRGARIVWVNEIDEDSRMDSAFLKLIADGSQIPYKPLYKNQEQMPNSSKLIVVSNAPMKIKSDNGLKRRMIEAGFWSQFQEGRTEDDVEARQFVRDPTLPKRLTGEFRDAFMNLISDYAKKFYEKKCLPELPQAWKETTEESHLINDSQLEWFNEFYVKCEEDVEDDYVYHKEFTSHFNGKFYPNDMGNTKSWRTFLKRIEIYDYDSRKKINSKQGFLKGFTSIGN